jgi:hypothetical protein
MPHLTLGRTTLSLLVILRLPVAIYLKAWLAWDEHAGLGGCLVCLPGWRQSDRLASRLLHSGGSILACAFRRKCLFKLDPVWQAWRCMNTILETDWET